MPSSASREAGATFRCYMEDRLTAVLCVICGKPVRLEECKVNDLSEPVHELCLADQLIEEIKKHKVAFGQQV